MSAWHTEHFDNDAAMDWIYDFSLMPAVAVLESTFMQVLHNSGTIAAADGAKVLAAAEVIAATRGQKTTAWPEDIPVFTELTIDTALIALALQAIEKVCSNQSGLKEQWQKTSKYDEWLKAVEGVKQRLKG